MALTYRILFALCLLPVCAMAGFALLSIMAAVIERGSGLDTAILQILLALGAADMLLRAKDWMRANRPRRAIVLLGILFVASSAYVTFILWIAAGLSRLRGI